MPASIPILVGITERSDGVFRKKRIEFYHIFRLQNSLDPMYVPAARKKNCCRRGTSRSPCPRRPNLLLLPPDPIFTTRSANSRKFLPFDLFFRSTYTFSTKRRVKSGSIRASSCDADRNSGPERSYSRFPARHAIPSPGFRRPKVEGLSALEPVTRHSALHAMRQVDRSRWMDRSDINVDAGR